MRVLMKLRAGGRFHDGPRPATQMRGGGAGAAGLQIQRTPACLARLRASAAATRAVRRGRSAGGATAQPAICLAPSSAPLEPCLGTLKLRDTRFLLLAQGHFRIRALALRGSLLSELNACDCQRRCRDDQNRDERFHGCLVRARWASLTAIP